MKRIFRNTWLEMRPFEKDLPTDQFYIKLSNRLKDKCYQNPGLIQEFKEVEEEDYDHLACFVAAYFEDVVSEIGIFQTFVRLCRKKCGKTLPFYNFEEYDEYLEDDINEPDIEFLIWYYLSNVLDYIVLPDDPCIATMAGIFFDELDSQWDFAPENKPLRDFFTFNGNPDNYFEVREYMQRIFFNNYLESIGAKMELEEMMEDTLNGLCKANVPPQEAQVRMQGQFDDFIFQIRSQLWGVTMTEWCLEYVEDDSPIARNVRTLSPKINGIYTCVEQDDDFYTMERISNKQKYCLLKDSVKPTLLENGMIILTSMVKWLGNWHFSGALAKLKHFEADMVEKDREMFSEELAATDIKHWEQAEELTEKMHKEYLKLFGTDMIFGSKKEIIEKYRQFIRATGADEKVADTLEGHAKNTNGAGLLYFDEAEGVMLDFDVNEAFCSNKCTDPRRRLAAFENIVFDPQCSIGLMEYAINDYVEQDSTLLNMVMDMFREDFDFLAAFYKPYDVLRRPEVTLLY